MNKDKIHTFDDSKSVDLIKKAFGTDGQIRIGRGDGNRSGKSFLWQLFKKEFPAFQATQLENSFQPKIDDGK